MSDQVGHAIVCGLHGVGPRVVEQLYLAGVPAVVVDDRPAPRMERPSTPPGYPAVRK